MAAALGLIGVPALAATISLPTLQSLSALGEQLAPGAVGQVSAQQDGIGSDILVSWVPGSGAPASGASVDLLALVRSTTSRVATVTCAGGCTDVVFRYLQDGVRYEAEVWPTDAHGFGPARMSPVVTPVDRCPQGACVSVNALEPLGPASHAAQGFVDSVYPGTADAADLAQLGTTMYRSQPLVEPHDQLNWSSWDVAQEAGIPTTLILEPLWINETGGVTPWSNWVRYSAWVATTVQQIEASGHAPTYWEPFNEPGAIQDGFVEFLTTNANELLQQFLVTYDAIRSIVPNAQIIGPSLAAFEAAPQTPTTTYRGFDLLTFLNFCESHDLQLAAVSWHFIADDLSWYSSENSLSPQDVVDEVQQVRQWIAARPTLGHPEIFVNEYEPPERESIPGWDVGYLSALTNARVDSAVLSCWTSGTALCNSPTLDGLLAANGSTPMPDYWVRSAYAAMSGTMVTTGSTDDSVSALASYDAATETVSALVGRGVGCSQNLWCDQKWRAEPLVGPEPITVQLEVPWSSGDVRLSGYKVPGAVLQTMAQPDRFASEDLRVTPIGGGLGTVSVTIPALDDGDAWSLVFNQV
jgi:hypothetical protein